MILGVGTDLVDARRIEALHRHFGERFLRRIFTSAEIAEAGRYPAGSTVYYGHFARRFAAKEAGAKALGTGIGKYAAFTDIGVLRQASGHPVLRLTGAAETTLHRLTPAGMRARTDLSLTDEPPFALAFAVISCFPET